jgi:hypothetical protein
MCYGRNGLVDEKGKLILNDSMIIKAVMLWRDINNNCPLRWVFVFLGFGLQLVVTILIGECYEIKNAF